MKTSFDPRMLLLLIFISAIFPPISLAYTRLSFFSPQKEASSTPGAWSPDLNNDVLSLALSKAFPSSFQRNPTYASALDIFRSLESKPSCHRSAAASLVLDCSALEDGGSQSGGLKVSYAARLAVCEFEATGISYPQECGDLGGKWQEIKVMKCIKRLEERPQWWTTLSNNIQSATVMCSAVRHEVEKDQLLNLHKNITTAQESLFTALDTSLNEAWESIAAQKEFTGAWKIILEDVLGELMEVRGGMADAMKTVEADATQVVRRIAKDIESARKGSQEAASDLGQLLHRVRSGVEILEERSKVLSKGMEAAMNGVATGATVQYEAIRLNSDLVQQVNMMLSSRMGPSIDDLLHAIEILSFKITDSLAKLEKFEDLSGSYSLLFASLSASYTELAQNHMALTVSLENQQEAQRGLLSSLKMAHQGANITLGHLLKMMDTLNQSLDDAGVEIRSWNVHGMSQTWMLPGALILGLGVLLGRESGKAVLTSFGVLAGLFLFYVGSLHFRDLTKILDFGSLSPGSSTAGPISEGGLGTKYHQMLSQGLFGSLLAVFFSIATVLFVNICRRRRSLALPTKKLQ